MSSPLLPKDNAWIRQAFLVRSDQLDNVAGIKEDQSRRFYSTASAKFTDTTPGGNLAINPPPQFTCTADIKASSPYHESKGMGRYYSEAIDDNSQVIYMRFGVPQFNSLTTFFTTFYDSNAGQLARTGRGGGIFYSIGAAAALVVTMATWQFTAIRLAGLIFRFATGSPSSKFYYLKPTMPMYWDAVTNMVNRMAVNRGIIPSIYGPKDTSREAANKLLSEALPDIFNEGGGINVYSMAGRAQRLARLRYAAIEKEMEDAQNTTLEDAISKAINTPLVDTKKQSYYTYLQSWFGGAASTATPDGTLAQATTTNANPSPATATTGNSNESISTSETEKTSFMDFFKSELDDGSAFASFRVNYTGPISESFSNSVGESELATKINGMSSSSRSTNFNFAGGNVDGGAVGKILGAVGTAVKDVVAGVADGLAISGLAALSGSAFVDIPKYWQQSVASLPRASYTINLVSPYGNPMSQMLNLDIQLAMLLAAALPMATGKQSYTSPFLLELYDKGRCQTRLGMIDSLSITRGTGNLGFNREGHAMAIDVSFSIVDMSSILTMPIGEGFTSSGMKAGMVPIQAGVGLGAAAGAFKGYQAAGVLGAVGGATLGAVGGLAVGTGVAAVTTPIGMAVDMVSNSLKTINNVFSDDTTFNDYMAVLAGMDLADQIYSTHKFKFNITNAVSSWKSYYTKAHFANIIGGELPARTASALFKGVVRN